MIEVTRPAIPAWPSSNGHSTSAGSPSSVSRTWTAGSPTTPPSWHASSPRSTAAAATQRPKAADRRKYDTASVARVPAGQQGQTQRGRLSWRFSPFIPMAPPSRGVH